jgi:hypothetical protein
VRAGRWRGGQAPYGYRAVSRGTINYKGKPIFDIEKDPEASEVVRTIYTMYSKEHYGARHIAMWLNDRGIPTKTGDRWHSSAICHLLRCRTYTGTYILHRKVKTDKQVVSPFMPHLEIIPQAEWDAVQRQIDGNIVNPNKRPPTRRGGLLLTKLAYCGECGEKLTSFTTVGKNKSGEVTRYYYRCRDYLKPRSTKTSCQQTIWAASRLDGAVIQDAKAFLLTVNRDQMIADYESRTRATYSELTAKLERAEADVSKKETEVKKLKDEIMKNILGESTFSQELLSGMLRTKELELCEARNKHDAVMQEVFDLSAEMSFMKKVCSDFDDWAARFDEQNLETKKAMLIDIIDRITVHQDRIEVQYKIKLDAFTGDESTPPDPDPAQVSNSVVKRYDLRA